MEAELIQKRRWLILATLCLSVLLVAIDNTIVNMALPTLNRRLGATASELQWVVDMYTVCLAGLLLFFGQIGDRYGRKRVLQIGLVLFADFSAGVVGVGCLLDRAEIADPGVGRVPGDG